ncbi:MAG TPA: type IV toxin-antitoxin system AbiEi family antitoxin domain-containing protein [Thermoleophilaceae bacterium]|nr:type IV toxin-antitoxin system AbiEi family antitoxin domain-containing protein [Thermoleophilaceae bacterium]
MPSGDTPPEARLGRIAGRQHGVVTHRQLDAIGIRGTAVKRRVATGRLVRLYRGVYGVGHLQQTREARWIAAVMASGPGAVLSHLDAAALWEIYESRGANIHVTTTTRSARRLPGVRVHRSRRLDPTDITVKDAIPVTTVARTLIDLTDLLPSDRILRAIREAEYLGLLDLDTLFAAVQRAHGRHNVKVLKQAIERHRPGQIVRRELEHLFLELVHQAGVRQPETNVKVRTRHRSYEVDCLWREEGVAVELDGRAAHARATAFEEDRARDAALSAIGLRPLRFTWYRVTREGADVIAELEATLAQAGRSLDAA